MLDITVTDVTPKEAKPGDIVTVKYAIDNNAQSNECYKVNIWWRSEKISGDTVGTIPGYFILAGEIKFTMPDKPENPTKFSINVYRGTGLIGGMPPNCLEFNDAPDDFEVFEVTKIEGPAPPPEKKDTIITFEVVDLAGNHVSYGDKPIYKDQNYFIKAGLFTRDETSYLPIPKDPIPNKTLEVYINNVKVGTVTTGSNGTGNLGWTPKQTGTFTITLRFSGDDTYNPASKTVYVEVVEKPPPERKDCVIDEVKILDSSGKEVDFSNLYTGRKYYIQAGLFEAGWFGIGRGNPIPNATIKVYINGTVKTIKTSSDGTGKVDWTPQNAGTYTIKFDFEGDNTYNPASKTITVKVEQAPERAIEATVVDPPEKGWVVVGVYNIPTVFQELERYEIPETGTVLIDGTKSIYQLWATVTLRVVDDTDYVLYEKDASFPSSGVRKVTLYGYSGCHWRITLTSSATEVKSGNSVKLTATLIKNPNQRADEGLEVVFYKRKAGEGEEAWVKIGANVTDEYGRAYLQHTLTTSSEEGEDFEFVAQYDNEDTYCNTVTVTVKPAGAGGFDLGALYNDIVNTVAQWLNVSAEEAKRIVNGLIVVFAVLFFLSLLR